MTTCCDTPRLVPNGPQINGQQWYVCANCQQPTLMRSDGEVIRIGKG